LRSVTNRLVHSNSVHLLIRGAGRHDVYSGRRGGQGSVVPGEGHVVADLVELRTGHYIGREEGDATGRETCIVGGFMGSGGCDGGAFACAASPLRAGAGLLGGP